MPLLGIFGCSATKVKTLNLKDRNETRIVEQFGEADASSIFKIERQMLEYRMALQARFPNYAEQEVEVKEWIWKNKKYSRAVWFAKENGQWKVVDAIQWAVKFVFEFLSLPKSSIFLPRPHFYAFQSPLCISPFKSVNFARY